MYMLCNAYCVLLPSIDGSLYFMSCTDYSRVTRCQKSSKMLNKGGRFNFFFDDGFSDSELKNPADGGADQLGSGRRENLSRRFHV